MEVEAQFLMSPSTNRHLLVKWWSNRQIFPIRALLNGENKLDKGRLAMKCILMQLDRYKKELNGVDKELASLPLGSFIKRGSSYCLKHKGRERGITRKPEIIRQICRREYLRVRKRQLEHNFSILNGIPGKLDERTPGDLIAALPAVYQSFPTPYFYHPKAIAWLDEQPPTNPYKSEDLIYTSTGGTKLRSKSERDIANQLEQQGLLYYYEGLARFGGKRVYPDFTVKNPYTNYTALWEHFGAFHQPNYIQSMNEKMTLYREYGYTPLLNLVYTFESDIRDPNHLKSLIQQVMF